MDISKISRRIADSITAMPIEKSNIPRSDIPEYMALFEKFPFKVNLYKSRTNFVEEGVNVFETLSACRERLSHYIERLKEWGPPNYRMMIQEIPDALNSLESDMINVITNIDQLDSGSKISEKWLAHDMLHAIQSNLDLQEIRKAVKEDIENPEPIPNRDLEDIFFYWLPNEFLTKSPSYEYNKSLVRDLFPDLLVHYMASGATLPDHIDIEYKPLYIVGSAVYRYPPTSTQNFQPVIIKPGASATQKIVNSSLRKIYQGIYRELSKYVGGVFLIG